MQLLRKGIAGCTAQPQITTSVDSKTGNCDVTSYRYIALEGWYIEYVLESDTVITSANSRRVSGCCALPVAMGKCEGRRSGC